jgi:hypothetical protein
MVIVIVDLIVSKPIKPEPELTHETFESNTPS